MTDKQTIDDCIHLNEWKHCDICEKLIKTKDGANGKKREHLLTEEELRCDFYPNCYRKQVLRKERQCERLKKEKTATEEASELFVKNADEIALVLENKLDQMKSQLLDQEAETLKAAGIIHNLEQALADIKAITEHGKRFAEGYMTTGEQKTNILTYADAILQKIKDVMPDEK